VEEPACPSCGEAEALLGRRVDADIALTCERCGAEWMRGEARCKRCGRPGGVSAQQRMTRHPRGTLLAVVGMRQVPLCRDCDDDVLEAALLKHRPVPEGYVSRFLFGEPPPDRPAKVEWPPTNGRRRRPDNPKVDSRRSPPKEPAESGRADPTVRQAVEVFLEAAGSPADALAMLLLGTELGPSTRLSLLDTPATAAELTRWLDQTFQGRHEQRQEAAGVLRRALGLWQEKGWLIHDVSAALD
jgi:hypothetical protein